MLPGCRLLFLFSWRATGWCRLEVEKAPSGSRRPPKNLFCCNANCAPSHPALMSLFLSLVKYVVGGKKNKKSKCIKTFSRFEIATITILKWLLSFPLILMSATWQDCAVSNDILKSRHNRQTMTWKQGRTANAAFYDHPESQHWQGFVDYIHKFYARCDFICT